MQWEISEGKRFESGWPTNFALSFKQPASAKVWSNKAVTISIASFDLRDERFRTIFVNKNLSDSLAYSWNTFRMDDIAW
jgi:hypothetical protein